MDGDVKIFSLQNRPPPSHFSVSVVERQQGFQGSAAGEHGVSVVIPTFSLSFH